MEVYRGGVIVYRNNETGTVWSNAFCEDAQTPFGADPSILSSPVRMTYYQNRQISTTLNSYQHAVDEEQYRVYVDGGTVYVEYITGISRKTCSFPLVSPQERFEGDILMALDEGDANYLKRRYTLYTYADLQEDAVFSSEVMASVPGIRETPLYILTDIEAQTQKVRTAEILRTAGYTQEQMEADAAWSPVR